MIVVTCLSRSPVLPTLPPQVEAINSEKRCDDACDVDGDSSAEHSQSTLDTCTDITLALAAAPDKKLKLKPHRFEHRVLVAGERRLLTDCT